MTEERWSPSSSTQSLSSPQQPLLRFRRISNKGDWDSVSQLMHINDSSNNSNNQHVSTCETLDRVHGIFVTSQDSTFCIGFCTFYLSYSTWDGRVIFLDRLEVGSPPQDALSPLASHSLLSLSLRYTLADIGLKLECSRFVWQVSTTSTNAFALRSGNAGSPVCCLTLSSLYSAFGQYGSDISKCPTGDST